MDFNLRNMIDASHGYVILRNESWRVESKLRAVRDRLAVYGDTIPQDHKARAALAKLLKSEAYYQDRATTLAKSMRAAEEAIEHYVSLYNATKV